MYRVAVDRQEPAEAVVLPDLAGRAELMGLVGRAAPTAAVELVVLAHSVVRAQAERVHLAVAEAAELVA